jgi:hypothetical protein
MKNLADKIADKIKKEEIKPKSKWIFLLKDYFIWSIFGFSIIIGGLAFVVIIFILTTNDWDMHRYLGSGVGIHFLTVLPRVWIGTLILFLLVAYYNYRHTKGGYRYKTYLVVLGSVAMSIVIGTGLFFMGLGNKVEQAFSNNLPYYGRFMEHRMEMWNQPEQGLLAGEIVEIESVDVFNMKDFGGNIWQVDISGALWRRGGSAQVGKQIKIIGAKKTDDEFTAQEIRPWAGRRGDLNNRRSHRRGRIE